MEKKISDRGVILFLPSCAFYHNNAAAATAARLFSLYSLVEWNNVINISYISINFLFNYALSLVIPFSLQFLLIGISKMVNTLCVLPSVIKSQAYLSFAVSRRAPIAVLFATFPISSLSFYFLIKKPNNGNEANNTFIAPSKCSEWNWRYERANFRWMEKISWLSVDSNNNNKDDTVTMTKIDSFNRRRRFSEIKISILRFQLKNWPRKQTKKLKCTRYVWLMSLCPLQLDARPMCAQICQTAEQWNMRRNGKKQQQQASGDAATQCQGQLCNICTCTERRNTDSTIHPSIHPSHAHRGRLFAHVTSSSFSSFLVSRFVLHFAMKWMFRW